MYNVLEYKEGVSFFGSSSGWENKVEMGKGRSAGIEFMAQKTLGRTTDGCPTLYPKVIVSLPKAVSTTVNGSHINMTEDTIST